MSSPLPFLGSDRDDDVEWRHVSSSMTSPREVSKGPHLVLISVARQSSILKSFLRRIAF
jgi:hypothetical protein